MKVNSTLYNIKQIGVSLELINYKMFQNSLTPLSMTLVVEVLILMSIIAAIVVHSAININRTLKEGAFSKNLRKLHHQMFILLLLQVCSFILVRADTFRML